MLLQVNNSTTGTFKIKNIRKIEKRGENACCSPTPASESGKLPCCGPPTTASGGVITNKVPGFIEWLETPTGSVPRISSQLKVSDQFGACKARWGIGRMNYIVPPGLYAIGRPTATDPVLVTANYKMSYDIVRQSLSGRTIWLLVLETFGINVWCAAGKGTFGTGELVQRVTSTGLAKVVSHRRLILPILGAPGVAAHEFTRRTGFSVSYATIRAADLPEYLDNGTVTTQEMRQLTFTLYERLVLIPVELVMGLKSIAVMSGIALLLGTLLAGTAAGFTAFIACLGACLTGVVLGPLLLPLLPGRSFAVKGAFAGLLWSALFYAMAGGSGWHCTVSAALFLTLPTLSAFYTLNFTGCSTYTSRSGVKKEMHIALPAMAGMLLVSLILLVAGRYLI